MSNQAPGLAQYQRVGVPEILNFSNAEYDAGTQNWSILQDESGIVYFGNNKGVLQFDGTYWNRKPMPNLTIVRSLAQDSAGRIYIGAQDELGYLSFRSNGLMDFTSLVDAIPEEFRSFEDVWKIFPLSDAVFFCSRRAVFIFKGDTCSVYKPADNGSFENYFLANGRVFAQLVGVGLTEWDGHEFILLPGAEQFAESRLAAVLPHQSELLIISDFKGMFLMDEEGIRPWETECSDFLRANQAYCAAMLPDSSYAVGTAQDGLLIIGKHGNVLAHLNKDAGLQNNTVLSILSDRQHNFWLGLDNGIDYVKMSAPFTLLRSESGVEGTGYASVLFDNELYLGTNQGLFAMPWPVRSDPFTAYPFRKVQNLTGQVWQLNLVDASLLASCHDGLFEVGHGTASQIGQAHGSWKMQVLRTQPDFAIEGTYAGLNLYQKTATEDGVSWKFLWKVRGFEESARVMEQDDTGNVWVSHYYKGLYRVRLTPDLRQANVTQYNSKNGFASDLGINVATVQGEVLFTTPHGVYQYEPTQDTFVPHERLNNLLGGQRNIYRLIEDGAEQLWVSYDDHFGVLQIQDNGFLTEPTIKRHFFDQLQNDLVDGFESVYALDSDDIFIGTEKGYILYDAAALAGRDLSFNALIRSVSTTAGKDSLIFSNAGQISMSAAQPVSLPRTLSSLKFTYAAPFFEHLGQIQYRYQLKGFESEYSDWTIQTSKEFTNLPFGQYTFIIQARNAYGDISEPQAFDFVIRPPWYQTNTAYACYGIAGIVLMWYLFRASQRRVERETAALVDEQTRTLAEKEAEFRAVIEETDAEVIRLKNENLHADIKHKTSELASATMHLVQKGEILLSVKRDLKNLHRTASPENKRKLQQLIHSLDDDLRLDNNWEQFEKNFDLVHENFLRNLRNKFPDLTPKDQKLCAYLRMNLTTKEIAPLMNISVRGVEISRYRLRKKLGIDTEINLTDFIMRF